MGIMIHIVWTLYYGRQHNPHYARVYKYISKPHYSEDYTMRIRTMGGLAVHRNFDEKG